MPEAAPRPRTARAIGSVQAVRSLSPHMRRITLGGPGIAEFIRADGVGEPAAWVKVFLPSGEGRAYTLSHVDPAAGTLALDFVLHGPGSSGEGGPAATWAATVGEAVGIAGPRSGGFVLPADARWVMLAGDATALPAIQSIAARLPAGINAKAYVEVASEPDRQQIESPARLRVQWATAQPEPGLSLCQMLLYRPMPSGPGYVWMAGESGAIRTLKLHYAQERQLPRHRLAAKGYWKAGEADHRDIA